VGNHFTLGAGLCWQRAVMAVHVIVGLVVAIPAGVEFCLASHRPFSAG